MKPNLNRADIELLKGTFATKDDLKDFATKNDLKSFATKKDLAAMEKRVRLSSKKDLQAMEKRVNLDLKAMEKRQDEKYPTKAEMEKQFEDLAIIIADSFQSVEARVSRLEQNAQIAIL